MCSLDQLFRIFLKQQHTSKTSSRSDRICGKCYLMFKRVLVGLNCPELSQASALLYYRKLRIVVCYLKPFFVWLEKQMPVKSTGRQYSCHSATGDSTFQPINRYELFKSFRRYISGKGIYRDRERMSVDSSVLIQQLIRRFNSFFQQSDVVFFQGIADYIKFVLGNSALSGIVQDNLLKNINGNGNNGIEANNQGLLQETWQNSELASWFNLELVYFLILRKKEIFNGAQELNGLQAGLRLCAQELDLILKEKMCSKHIFFNRELYNTDIIRIHHFLLEALERNGGAVAGDSKCQAKYTYTSSGIPSGTLILPDFVPLYFSKLPAVVIQFFYLRRHDTEYYSYKDFNEFKDKGVRPVQSNDFRLLVNSINQRIRNQTEGTIKKILVKQKAELSTSKTNYYQWNKKLNENRGS